MIGTDWGEMAGGGGQKWKMVSGVGFQKAEVRRQKCERSGNRQSQIANLPALICFVFRASYFGFGDVPCSVPHLGTVAAPPRSLAMLEYLLKPFDVRSDRL